MDSGHVLPIYAYYKRLVCKREHKQGIRRAKGATGKDSEATSALAAEYFFTNR